MKGRTAREEYLIIFCSVEFPRVALVHLYDAHLCELIIIVLHLPGLSKFYAREIPIRRCEHPVENLLKMREIFQLEWQYFLDLTHSMPRRIRY